MAREEAQPAGRWDTTTASNSQARVDLPTGALKDLPDGVPLRALQLFNPRHRRRMLENREAARLLFGGDDGKPVCREQFSKVLESRSQAYLANLPERWNIIRGLTVKGRQMTPPRALPPPLARGKRRECQPRKRGDLRLQTELRPQDVAEVQALLQTNFHPGVADLIAACVEASQHVRSLSDRSSPETDVRVWALRTAGGALSSAVAWRPLDVGIRRQRQRGIEVLFLATEQSARGTGCAEDLVARLEDYARLSGLDFLCVAVVPAAPGFWSTCGLQLCASTGVVRGDRPAGLQEAAVLLSALGDNPARLVGSFLAAAPLRDALLGAMVRFDDTPLYVKSGLAGPEFPLKSDF